jgi:hypothetical protein
MLSFFPLAGQHPQSSPSPFSFLPFHHLLLSPSVLFPLPLSFVAHSSLLQGNYIAKSTIAHDPRWKGPHHWMKEGEAPKPSQKGDKQAAGIDVCVPVPFSLP